MIPKAEANKTSPLHRRRHHISFTFIITTVSIQELPVFPDRKLFETYMHNHDCFNHLYHIFSSEMKRTWVTMFVSVRFVSLIHL
ncbi:hypothetical protein OUZ56_011354 [Daphnia magna]|uniref:Uncharacterized protein n=1 Tax=Daphnia magna TaxID=35525 RepID=A0ABQ9YZT9_9CRUS|nr:hypothetical protein OUZ56_011354 [Daphnia magna]